MLGSSNNVMLLNMTSDNETKLTSKIELQIVI